MLMGGANSVIIQLRGWSRRKASQNSFSAAAISSDDGVGFLVNALLQQDKHQRFGGVASIEPYRYNARFAN